MAKKAYVWDGSAWVEITSQPTVPTGTTGNAGIVQLVDSTSSVSTANAATPNSVKTAYDRGSLGVTNAATAQTTANTAVTNAATAQTTANTAVTNAATAQTTADAAVPKSTVTTAGDIIYATGSSAVTRLGIGSTNNILTAGASAPAYQTLSALHGAVATVPSQAAYDIPYATSATALGRIANGTTGQFLAATTGAAPAWSAPSGMDVLVATTLSGTSAVTYSAISQNYKYVYLVGYCSAGGNFYLDSFTDTSAAGIFSNYYSVSGYTRSSTDQIFRTVGASVTTVGASGTQSVNMTGTSFSVTSTLSGITQMQFSLRIDSLNTTTTKILTGSSNCQASSTNGNAYCTWFNASLGKSSGGIFGITGFRINFGTSATGNLVLYGGY